MLENNDKIKATFEVEESIEWNNDCEFFLVWGM